MRFLVDAQLPRRLASWLTLAGHSTGNISNVDLEHLLRGSMPAITKAFEQHRYVEVGRAALLIHD